MRRWVPFLVLGGLALLALHPLWWQPAPYLFLDDGFLHLFRVFEFDRVLREGVVYPRWAPDLAYGYGYPLFNYYPPLAYYLTETLHLVGLSLPLAVQGAFVVIVSAGLSGAYRLGVELFGDEKRGQGVGLLTACAYVFFPYFLLDMYTRGAIAESLAAAILPWLVWSLRRLLRHQTLAALLLTALFSAGLVLSHNLSALFSAPFLALYVLWEWFHLPAAQRLKGALVLGGAIVLGAALAAIYWLPLLAEMSLVNVSREAKPLAIIVQYSILGLRDVLQFSIPYQYHEAPFPLPLMPMLLAALSLLLALIGGRRLQARSLILFFGVIALAATLLLSDVTLGIWLSMPVMMTLQFPWRLSVLIGLCVAVMVGALPAIIAQMRGRLGSVLVRLPTSLVCKPSPGLWLGRAKGLFAHTANNVGRVCKHALVQPWLTAALAALMVWVGLANLSPQRLNNPRDEITLAQLVRFEVNSHNVGLATMGEYLPLTVKSLPTLLEFKPNTFPIPDIRLEQYSTVRRVMTVSAPDRFALTLHSFYFPDWQVTIDGRPAPAGPSTAMGLLTADVPAGEHRVVFESTGTWPRWIGSLSSGIGLVVFCALMGIAFSRERGKTLPVILAAVALLTPFAIPTALAGISSPAALQPTQVEVSPELGLIGLRLENARLESNIWRVDSLPLTLNLQVFWQVKQQLRDAPFTWQLVDAAGHVSGQWEQLPRYAAGLAGTWVPNEVVPDYYDLALQPGIPPGRYSLQVGLGDKLLPVADIELTSGSAPPRPTPKIEHSVQAQVGDRIRLIGFNAPATAKPGSRLPLTLYWQTARDIPEDLTVFVQLIDTDRRLVAQSDGLTNDGFLPTTLWQANRIVPDERNIDIPGSLPPGLYHLVAGLYRFDDLARLPVTTLAGPSPDDQIELGTIKVPMQANASPEHAQSISLGTNIRLAGFDLAAQDSTGRLLRRSESGSPSHLVLTSGQTMALTVYWQALTPVASDYKVFIHIVDAGGNVVAQQDQMPGKNRYPTHIWDAGEQVLDQYALPLNLPAGRYLVAVGMYDAESGERLVVHDASGNELPDRQEVLAQLEVVDGK